MVHPLHPDYHYHRVKDLINNCKNVYAFVLIDENQGQYVRVYKNDLLKLLKTGCSFEKDKFDLHQDGNLYIN
tara:strand:- start:551 stop:766 length:216 start_codon:yes stop_codon:yes gene_type:complete